MKKLVPQSIKNIYHLFQAFLANFWYGFPSKKIKVIGVTGTNGKTTTCQMIIRILEKAGYKTAMNSTINFRIGEREWVNKTKFTTLSSFKIQKFIKDAVESECEYLILETSSHSLDQFRVWGIKYEVAVITNATREHLDYHKTMEKYRKAKRKLFSDANVAIVNLDMENPEDYLDCETKEKYGYGTKISNFQSASPTGGFSTSNQIQNPNDKFKNIIAEDISLGISDSKFKIQNLKFKIHLPGLFNIENALAAICVGLSQNIGLEIIRNALEEIKGISGRMEYIPNNKGINIVVDYAVTPDSLEKLYSLIQKINNKKGKIISVFGSCGERDRGKRPIMGEIVSNFADHVILTNEDPYSEDPWRIIEEVAKGLKNKEENKNFWKIFDRREAIKKALLLAEPGDFVAVTGKGAEETMAVGKKKIPWNDRKVILEELNKL